MAKKPTKFAKKVGAVMHEYKHGSLKSGGSDKKVRSRKQAVAIALNSARKATHKRKK